VSNRCWIERAPPVVMGMVDLALLGCNQPAPKCTIAHGAFSAKYELVSGSGSCSMLHGEELDVQGYIAPISKTNRNPDYNRTSIGIQPRSITDALAMAAGVVEANPADKAYALGDFATAEPKHDDFCVAPKLSVARLRLPAAPEHMLDECTTVPTEPPVDLRYEFSNVRVYDTAGAIGTQFAADLSYTSGECSARYRVWAVYPSVSCAAAVPISDAGVTPEAGPSDAGEGSTSDAGTVDASAPSVACPPSDPGSFTADDSLCAGPGINPDFALRCEEHVLLCVPGQEPPALR
jgi:hypothetical protein